MSTSTRLALLASFLVAACGRDGGAPLAPPPTPTPTAAAKPSEPPPREPRPWDEHLARGRAAAQAKDWPEAIAELDLALVAKPDSLAVVSELGWALFQDDQDDRARAVMMPLAAMDAHGGAPVRGRASIRYNLGRIAEASGASDAAIRFYQASLADRDSATVRARLVALDPDAASDEDRAPEVSLQDRPGVIDLWGLPAVSARGDVIALGDLDEPGDTCGADAVVTLMRTRDAQVIRTFREDVRNSGADALGHCEVEPAHTRGATRLARDVNRVLVKDQFRPLRELHYGGDDRAGAGLRVRDDDAAQRITITSDAGATLWTGPMSPLTGSCGGDVDQRPSSIRSVHVDPASDLVLITYGWGFDQCGCPPSPTGYHVLRLPR